MKRAWTSLLLVASGLALGFGTLNATTSDSESAHCSLRNVVGRWAFATDVGRQSLIPGQDGDITAIGMMRIDRAGNLAGGFDFTIADYGFVPDNSFAGSIVVDPNCTATLTFVNSAGISRTDSIAIVSKREMWGMSQDPSNLWTYRARRLSRY